MGASEGLACTVDHSDEAAWALLLLPSLVPLIRGACVPPRSPLDTNQQECVLRPCPSVSPLARLALLLPVWPWADCLASLWFQFLV